jgi:hypothetical protein
MKHILKFLTIGIVILLNSCEKAELTPFQAPAAINFSDSTAYKLAYTFLTNPEDEYIQKIPVRVLGDTVGYDRHFTAEVVQDTSTTATSAQYEVLGGIVKAGEFTGTLSVKLRNSPELETSTVSLKLKLVDSEDFKAGNIESNYFISVASTAAYRAIVLSTGLTSLTAAEYVAMGQTGAEVLGTQFGDYVKQWNLDHPNDHLKHDDGTQAGQEIVPLYYTKSKFD